MPHTNGANGCDGSNSASVYRVRHKSGNESYADLITKAILSVSEKRMSLAQIYDWLATNVPGLEDQRYLHSSKGWKNAVRHTLSINSRFRKITRMGRSAWWTLDYDSVRKPRTLPCSPLDLAKPPSLHTDDYELEMESFRPRRGTEPAVYLFKYPKEEACNYSTPVSPVNKNHPFDLKKFAAAAEQQVKVRQDDGTLSVITVPKPLNLKTKTSTEMATQTDMCDETDCNELCPNCRSQSFDFQLSPMFTVDNEPTYKPETTFSFPGLPNDLKDITVDPYLKCDIFQVLQDEQRPSWV